MAGRAQAKERTWRAVDPGAVAGASSAPKADAATNSGHGRCVERVRAATPQRSGQARTCREPEDGAIRPPEARETRARGAEMRTLQEPSSLAVAPSPLRDARP